MRITQRLVVATAGLYVCALLVVGPIMAVAVVGVVYVVALNARARS